MIKILILCAIGANILWAAWQMLFKWRSYKMKNATTVTIETPSWGNPFRDIAFQKTIKYPSIWQFVRALPSRYPLYRYYQHVRKELRDGESCACLIIPVAFTLGTVGYGLYRILR